MAFRSFVHSDRRRLPASLCSFLDGSSTRSPGRVASGSGERIRCSAADRFGHRPVVCFQGLPLKPGVMPGDSSAHVVISSVAQRHTQAMTQVVQGRVRPPRHTDVAGSNPEFGQRLCELLQCPPVAQGDRQRAAVTSAGRPRRSDLAERQHRLNWVKKASNRHRREAAALAMSEHSAIEAIAIAQAARSISQGLCGCEYAKT